MAKLTLDPILADYASRQKHNSNYDLIEAAVENTLSRDGSTPNSMSTELDMNSQRIINLGAPSAGSDAARWIDVTDAVDLTGVAVPALTGNRGRFLKTDGASLSWSFTHVITPQDYGAVGNGVADDTAALALAVTAATGQTLYFPEGTYKTTAPLALQSNSSYIGAGMGTSIISCTNGLISQLSAVNKTNVTISDLTVAVTSSSGTSLTGGVLLNGCTGCRVNRVEVTGVEWAGILLMTTSYTTVSECYLHDFNGTDNQDSADIAIYTVGMGVAASYNTISNNHCFGGSAVWHGVFIQGGAGAENPLGNIVKGNRIGTHASYGIIDYGTADRESFNQIVDNYIQDIQGTTLAGTSGMGIYVAGVSGDIVKGNTIVNCCVQTSNPVGLGAAGITANLGQTSPQTISIIGNAVYATVHGCGIQIENGDLGAVISGNKVSMPTTNDDSSAAIRLFQTSHTTVTGNQLYTFNNDGNFQRGVEVTASNGDAYSNIIIADNIIYGGTFSSVEFSVSGGSTLSQIIIDGNVCQSTSALNIPIRMSGISDVIITGNYLRGSSNTGVVTHASCTGVRYANNIIRAAGTNNLNASGTNTLSLFDKTNVLIGGVPSNAGTGLLVEMLGAAVPSGTFAVGDWIEQSVSVVGNPKRWRCTTAPGTFTSEGNL